ncbi:tetratricopeptide repeat protein 12 [Drosophila kikkawai]|uniref:Tetratricopeptide repeat protein 12 n=1 Tax=Drosophila kikkawai TaxID=30033 RepID=A0A6P4J8H4_DROKI|nr:tetratricopeptide repeat protein 12 [Drosophila kikkawai]
MSKTLEKKENVFGLNFELQPTQDVPVYQYLEANESFLKKPSMVKEVMEYLDTIENANKMDSTRTARKTAVDRKSVAQDDDFLVTLRTPTNVRSSFRRAKFKKIPMNTNQFTFMRQIEPEPEDRILARQQREIVAETFRRSGNFEYRKQRFEVAIDFYTRGLTYVKDTPVLYVNRAMCYIKLRAYKRGIMDCDHVLTYIDEKYPRAWLYRAAAYKRLNDEANYEYSVSQVKRLNNTETEFIDDFLEKMRTLL